MNPSGKYSVTGKLCMFPGPAAWSYVPIPNSKVPKVRPGGWGSIPVVVTVGGTTWRTSLFASKGKKYFVPIKKSVCKKESLSIGKTLTVKYSLQYGFFPE